MLPQVMLCVLLGAHDTIARSVDVSPRTSLLLRQHLIPSKSCPSPLTERETDDSVPDNEAINVIDLDWTLPRQNPVSTKQHK